MSGDIERKRTEPPCNLTFRIDNEFNPEVVPQYFQVAVNILEATKLAWSNPQTANSFVVVLLNKKKCRTAVRRNMEEPFYREYFVFEMHASIREIQRLKLYLGVMEPRFCASPRLIGSANIELSAVWTQPYHQVFRKWAQLTLPRNPAAGPVGFLKVDISIIFRGELQYVPPPVKEDNIEDNLLLPFGFEQQRANYVINIHSAFSLPNGSACYGDTQYSKLPNTFVKVSFCGLLAKTAVQRQNYNPNYNEQISMIEMFPNMSQLVRIEVCLTHQNGALCGTELRLDHISHDGENGFLPTFGPSLLPMYGPSCNSTLNFTDDGPYYKGSLLVSLKTVVPFYQKPMRSVSSEPLPVTNFDTLWSTEEFIIYCPVLEVSMLDRQIAGRTSGVAITMGEILNKKKSDNDFQTVMNEIKARKLYYTGPMKVVKTKPAYGFLYLPVFPVLQLATRMPDYRFRVFRNNMVQDIIEDLECAVGEVEYKLNNFEYKVACELSVALTKALDLTAANILNFLDIVQCANVSPNSSDNIMRRFLTELDVKQFQFQKEEIQKLYQHIMKRTDTLSASLSNTYPCYNRSQAINNKVSRKFIKSRIYEVKEILNTLKKLIFRNSEGWPDVIIWLLNNGSRVAYSRMSAADIIYSTVPEQCGKKCGRLQTISLKPIRCPKHNMSSTGCLCIAAKLEILMWMGLYRQEMHFSDYIPNGYFLNRNEIDMCIKGVSMMLECRAFIYRAKLNGGVDNTGVVDSLVRINVFNSAKQTQVKQDTLTPVWNQVLRIQKLTLSSPGRLKESPPIVTAEVYHWEFNTTGELIGRVQVVPVVDDNREIQFAPKLKWFQIYKGPEQSGQVLMSVQIVQIPEKVLNTTTYSTPLSTNEESFIHPPPNNSNNIIKPSVETIPPNLIPETTSYKVDIYWWGLRDVSIARKPCVVLEIDELNIKSEIIPEKKSNCNFPNGRTTHTFEAPLNEVYSPPINIRLYDSSTFGRSVFLGTNVLKNPNKYLIKWLPKNEREASLCTTSIMSSNFLGGQNAAAMESFNSTNKESAEKDLDNASEINKLKKLFGFKTKSEEEYTLLPAFKKDKDKVSIEQKPIVEEKDWWLRFFCSQKECSEDEMCINEKITIFPSELEYQPGFEKFKDWCATLKLYNGKRTGLPERDELLYCGFLKAGIAIYKWPPPQNLEAVSPSGVDLNQGNFFDDYPNNNPERFLVRVYIVKCFNLITRDFTGKSDPYVMVSCGKRKFGDRNNYEPKTLNPLFGKMFEFRITIPDDYLITVSVYDYCTTSPDELIGSTVIDLEDRIYTKHRATCGLPLEYTLSGFNKWRDNMRPSLILEEVCARNHIPPPAFPDKTTVLINGIEYRDVGNKGNYKSDVEEKENICLNILHKWYSLPICGYHLVPEHVETRTLYNPDKPGVDQGKIQMWVDIYGLDSGLAIPPPVDITPRKSAEYELRVVVWEAEGIKLNDHDILTGHRASDIYVKAWLGRSQTAQRTDVHYKSMTGIGNFNWRMIFRFQYQHAERKLVVSNRGAYGDKDDLIQPILTVQVIDSDGLCDDFHGSLSLNLNSMPRGARTSKYAKSKYFDQVKKVNLFTVGTVRGWWPLAFDKQYEPSGVIDLELTLLPKARAVLSPVGLGRDPPHPLSPPKRSSANFMPFIQEFGVLCYKERYKVGAFFVSLLLLFLIWNFVKYKFPCLAKTKNVHSPKY